MKTFKDVATNANTKNRTGFEREKMELLENCVATLPEKIRLCCQQAAEAGESHYTVMISERIDHVITEPRHELLEYAYRTDRSLRCAIQELSAVAEECRQAAWSSVVSSIGKTKHVHKRCTGAFTELQARYLLKNRRDIGPIRNRVLRFVSFTIWF